MTETTKQRLIAAASDLLDAGGQGAVTLRAVAQAVSVSHNAPYRHFRDRSALLAAVAERDFDRLRQAFQRGNDHPKNAALRLRAAVKVLVRFAREHPARYRLLFNDQGISSERGTMEDAAMGAFQAFAAIVRRCQEGGALPAIETAKLTGLIYATLHGAIDLELGGRASEGKGLGTIEGTVELLLDLLAQVRGR